MSNELITLDGTSNFNELAAMFGVQTQNEIVPRLRINRDAVDHEDNPIPVGTFAITLDGKTYYAKEVKFRPLINYFQYQHYDSVEKKILNRSLFIMDFKTEALDEKGGVRCGKLTKKQLEALPAAAKKAAEEKQKPIKVYRYVYGFVTMVDPVDREKKPADRNIVAVPCLFRLNGDNFMPIGEVMERITRARRLPFQYELGVSLIKKVNGATKYYQAQFDYDPTAMLPIPAEFNDMVRQIKEHVAEQNLAVMEKHKAALNRAKGPTPDEEAAGDIIDVKPGKLDDDFKDDLPI